MSADDLENENKNKENPNNENIEDNTGEFDDVRNILNSSDDGIIDLMSELEKLDDEYNKDENKEEDINSQENTNTQGDTSVTSLNDIINEDEINRLMQEDTDIELEFVDTEVINNVGVYDSSIVEEDEVLDKLEENSQQIDDYEENADLNELYENLEEFMKDINMEEKTAAKKPIIIAVAVLMSLILASVYLFTLGAKKIDQMILQEAINKEATIARYKPEDEKNVLFVDSAQEIDGNVILLEKIKLSKFNSYFYFKNNISPTDYIISLTDDNNNFYAIDLHFYKDLDGVYSIRFDPIKKDATKLYLTMESLVSDDKSMFVISLDANAPYPEVKYINDIIENDFEDFSINITYATVSKDSIHIDYTIEVPPEKEYGIVQGLNTDDNFITLSQDDKKIPARNSKPIRTKINSRREIGRMDFVSPHNMDSPLVMRFDDLYKEFELNKSFDIGYINANRDNLSIPLGDYELFLEGMPKFDNKYIFVFSVKDLRIKTDNRPDTFNNVEASLDIELVANTEDGGELKIKPTQVKSSNIGTDIMFELTKEEEAELRALPSSDISVNIKSMLLKINPINIPINIERGMTSPSTYYNILDDAIEEAFISRLKYKASKSPKMGIQGFSDEVLDNESIMKHYTPMGKVSDAKYSVNVLAKKVHEDNIDAIVQEAMQIRVDGKINIIYIKHRIRANFTDGNLEILSDVIIK